MRRKRIDVVRNRSTRGRARDQVSPRRAAAPTCARTSARWPRSRAASRCVEPRDPPSGLHTLWARFHERLAAFRRTRWPLEVDLSTVRTWTRRSPVREPASHKGWRSVRSSLQLILAILVVCAWDAASARLARSPMGATTFEWLPWLWQRLQSQRAVHCSRHAGCAAGVTRLSHERSDVHPDGRGVRPRVGGRSLACLLADSVGISSATGKVWPLSQYAIILLFLHSDGCGRCGGDVLVATRNGHPPGVASHANGSARAEG